MSELVNQEPININISNSTSSNGSNQSIISKILDVSLKILIPVGLLLGIGFLYLLITVVIPFVVDFGGTFAGLFGGDGGVGGFIANSGRFIFGPVGAIITGTGTLISWAVGR